MIYRPLRIGIVLCLLLSSLSAWAQRPGQDPNMHGPGRPFAFHAPTPEEREAARVRIGITVPQQAQIETMMTESGKQRRELSGQLRDLYQQLGTTYESYNLDIVLEKDLRKKITDVHRHLLKLHTETELQLRKILTQEQFTKMRSEMQQHHRDPRHGDHPPGAPNGRPGEKQ